MISMKIAVNKLTFFCYGLCCLIFVECATYTYMLQATHTVGLVEQGPVKIYILDVTGTAADAFRKELSDALKADGQFIVENYGIEPPIRTDTTSLIPGLILRGRHETHQESRTITEGTSDNQSSYQEVSDVDDFHYVIEDAVTKKELCAGVVNYVDVSKEEEQRSFFGSLVHGLLKSAGEAIFGAESSRRKKTIAELISSLKVHQEDQMLKLFVDKNLPELEEGTNYAHQGRWVDAIAKFQIAAENHSQYSEVHKAYFNLGIAYEYHYEFTKALASLKLAAELYPSETYDRELETCTYLANQYYWRKQVSINPTDSRK